MAWALLSETVPLYPLYALLFADSGLGDGRISVLFGVWSLTAVVAEVPSGALADRFSRRSALVASGVLQAVGYVAWTVWPGFAGFALGFVVWGIGGALASGALEALLHDGLVEAGRPEEYPRIRGRVHAVELLAQVPAALAASVLFAGGGYVAVGVASVFVCLAAAGLAARLPEAVPAVRGRGADAAGGVGPEHADARPAEVAGSRGADAAGAGEPEVASPELGYLATMRAGVAEAASLPMVRAALLVLAAVSGLDAVEEYLPLLARDWHVGTEWVPIALLGVSVAGAAGAALAGRAGRWPPWSWAAALVGGGVALLVADALDAPASLGLLAVYYGLYHLVLVLSDARLQAEISGPARATVTSVAGVLTEGLTFVVYGVWALGGLAAFVVLVGVVAVVVVGLPGRGVTARVEG